MSDYPTPCVKPPRPRRDDPSPPIHSLARERWQQDPSQYRVLIATETTATTATREVIERLGVTASGTEIVNMPIGAETA